MADGSESGRRDHQEKVQKALIKKNDDRLEGAIAQLA